MAEQAVPSEDQLKAPTQPVGSFTERAIDIGALEEVDGGKKSKRSSETKIIQDGLRLSLKGHKEAFVSFTYALSPLMEIPVRVDWKVLTAEGIECQHIRYHQLQRSDDLNELAAKYKKSLAVAMILVNTQDSYELEEDLCRGVLKTKKPVLPAIVITLEDGKKVKEYLARHDPGELHARFESKKQSHIEPTGVAIEGSPSPSLQHKSKKHGGGIGAGIRRSMRHRSKKSGVNLKEEIKQLMFPISGPLCVSKDERLFKDVMMVFYHYEENMQKERHSCDGAALRKLSKHLDEMFANDFPFYLLVAYRIYKKQHLYQCDELNPFIRSCVDKFEKLDQRSVSTTLESFLKMENFKVMFDQTNSNMTVFHLLENACIELMKRSFTIKGQEGNQLAHHFVYNRMLWISVAFKFHVERGAGPREAVDYWKNNLTSNQSLLQLNSDLIHSIKRGVEFGRMLQLPESVSFNSEHMADILTAGGTVRPFNQIKEFVIVLEPYVTQEEKFVVDFLTKPRACYQPFFEQDDKEKLKVIQHDGNLLAILQDGLAFLETIFEAAQKRHWQSTELDDEMKTWLSMLLGLVDMTSDHAESYLKDFLSPKPGSVTKQYSEHIKREVRTKLEDCFSRLTVEQFLGLYKAFYIWPNWVVEKYLKQYKIPEDVRVCSPTWIDFYGVFVERFTDAQHHKFLLEFIKTVAKCYHDQDRAKDFILDLLHLDVPGLFVTDTEGSTSTFQSDLLASSVPDEFSNFLADYIQRNNLQETILGEVETIWGLIADDSDFQQLILQVLQQELIPESLALHGPLTPPLKFLLDKCVTTICKELDSVRELPSKLEFCWGVVGSCCTKMPLSSNLEWVNSYYTVIDQLGRIYGVYCSNQQVQDTKSILDDESMPTDVSESSCDGVKVFFDWVAKAQQTLDSWRQKFQSRHINFDEIQLYTTNFSQLSRVATALSAESLVVDVQFVQGLKQDMLQAFEMLHIQLLRYIPGQPEAGWCALQHMLSKYGVALPGEILLTLKQHITFPGETKTTGKKDLMLMHPIECSVSNAFCPDLDIQLEITREVTMDRLKTLVHDIDNFLSPVQPYIELLTFFFLRDSEIFDKYLKLQLAKQEEKQKPVRKVSPAPLFVLPTVVVETKPAEVAKGVSIAVLGEVLKITKELLLKLIKGSASYNDITADGTLTLKSLDIELEFSILNQYAEHAKINITDAEGLKGVKAMLELFQYTHHIQVINGVCEQFHLTKCLEDSNLRELVTIVNVLDQRSDQETLTAKDAIEKVKKVTKMLRLASSSNGRFLELFSAVADSADFYHFIVNEKQFVGESGQALFQQQYQLLTTHLQHEEYNEVVLNHLFAAFKLIIPFTDKDVDFTTLMSRVSGLNAYDGRRQLETVNRNINLIRLWFSRAEGDTLQGMSAELRCVMDSGYYQFLFPSSDSVKAVIELVYVPHSTRYQNVGEVRDEPSVPTKVKLNEEQISDFVRKLGFMDVEGDSQYLNNHFLHLNQTAKKLVEYYSKLRELGHPEYLESEVVNTLQCSFTQDEADEMVNEASRCLVGWEEQMAELRSEYEQLLYFSVPKLLHLYQNLTVQDPSPESIMHDVGFLFENSPSVQAQLKQTVQTLLPNKADFIEGDPGEDTPMHIVGAFLSALYENFELSTHSLTLKRCRTPSMASKALSNQSTHILHSCQGFSQSQLIRLIISVYGGVPEPFEVLHCQPSTTEEELRLFLSPKRVTKTPFQYLILEVNKLPYQLQEALIRIHFELRKQRVTVEMDIPCVHFVETAPSLLQEMPSLLHRDYNGAEPSLDFQQAVMACQKTALNPDDFSCIQLVYGNAGDGKTHYIMSQLKKCLKSLKIAVNEAFTPLSAIKKLCTLPSDTPECAVFFNFTMLPPGDHTDESEREQYSKMIEIIGWFFFDLFILGYVEDPLTGWSFRFPGGMQFAIYVEVPSRDHMTAEMSLKEFFEDVPALGLLGTPHMIYPSRPFDVDRDVQLVCKYLKQYKIGGTKGIDRLYKESRFSSKKTPPPVKFSLDDDLPEDQCRQLLNHYTPPHMKKNKALQTLFVKYMKRRCAFLDNCPGFNYNPGSSDYVTNDSGKREKNDTTQLGSTLMDTMIKEVGDFCDPFIRENWAMKPHHQLIYDFKDGGGTFGLMSLHPDKISDEDKKRFKKIGVQMPSMFDLHTREWLDLYLSRALGVPLDPNKKRLTLIDESKYILTLDFALKMLNIHERAECGVPVIIEGETGVGKTFLIEMLSKLWNYSLYKHWSLYTERMMDFIKSSTEKLSSSTLKNSEDIIANISQGDIREDDLFTLGELPLEGGQQLYSVMRERILEMAGDPILSLLELREEDRSQDNLSMTMLVAAARFKNNVKDTARVVYKFLNARVKTMFYKLNVHAALQPSDITAFFGPIFEQAKDLRKAYSRFSSQTKVPFITVFLDEINTSSCLGLFKEVMVDKTLDGEPIPKNLFIIGACNPHRGNSLASLGNPDSWIRGTYYVRPLHPTLQCLMWDYGALGEQQERDYIHAKMKISNKGIANADVANLTDLIVLSQNLIRKYALEQLKKNGFSENDAHACSRSCVSQRDIQRVFTFYEWLMKMYKKFMPHGKFMDYPTRAIVVSLGLVYYIRLDSTHRKMYEDELNHKATPTRVSFSKCFDEELKWYINKIDLPLGIAKTTALKENLFANIVCTMTHTPLIIVGSPGSSKTLSFNLTLANLKGQESKVPEFRKTEIFKALDPQFYQCSRRTTSNEIQTVFSRAINRQRSHQRVPLPVYCVVFMDEAGLPEERHESLKVLHYYLDSQEVSFVAISNHVLDAAKTNRAVSLFRPEAPRKDLETLARGCLCPTPDKPPPELKKDMDMVASFCPAYEALMKNPKFNSFFGLRDFIHFISYLRRKRMEMLSPQLVMEALERNFNGVSKEDFNYICKLFFRVIHSNPDQVERRNILAILDSCMKDHSPETGAENEMRYKLIIDTSEDNSVVRLLFSTGVLKREKTRMYMCSDFHGDSQLQKINTIAAVRHSATEGHTVVMCQTDSIHESFYDLFNRRFHRIDANTGPRYYANIAIGAHIKPCRVHPDFECVVVVKQSELQNKNIPAPFLNRFEKYLLSHELILEAALENLPPALSVVLRTVINKVNEFLDTIGRESSIYGLQKDTLSSLLLTMLPHVEFEYKKYLQLPSVKTSVFDIKVRIVEVLLQALRVNAGFQLPTCSAEEMQLDAKEVMEHVLRDSEFAGQVLRMSTESSSTETIYMAATEALDALYSVRSINEVPKEVSANACLMISVLTQWLVRHLCKRLMQLMTSEALCMHHRKVPTSFIQAYLNHQHHFSLRALLESQTKILKSTVGSNANKLVCFTRSSEDLHQLPSHFPSSLVESSCKAQNKSILQELVFSDTEKLVVQKLSTMTTFTNVSDLLKSFAEHPTQKTVLVIVNMQETTRDVVNHLRIMIEEAESQSVDKKKLYTLLLHFPSSKVITHCYPAMFVQGWDFHYLDILGSSPKGVVIDIRDWFKQCCISSSSSDCSLVSQLSSLLHEAITFIASHMFFGSYIKSSFNRPMSLPERIASLETLFFEKGVGEILCERFNSYWQPSVMVEYLEKAALLAQQQETSLSVIDSLQAIFKNMFFDFLMYMVYKMNEGMNIDVIFNPGCTPEISALFLKVLSIYPIPKLSELKMLLIANDSSNFTMCDVNFSPPKFPFFCLVSSVVEKLVDQSRRDFSENVNMLGESAEPTSSLFQTAEQRRLKTMVEVIQIVQDKLEECAQSEENTVMSVAVRAMKSVNGLWQKYLEDFTHQKLRLEFGNSGISHKVLRAAFGKLEERSAIQRVAVLHVYIHLHKLNLAKIVSILRPLDQIEKAKAVLPSLTEGISSPSHILSDIESKGSLLDCPESLSSFIINTLFRVIAGISKNCTTPDNPKLEEVEEQQITLWFKAYKDVMSMPSLREHIYSSHSKTTDAQHTLMHILFLIIRSKQSHSTDDLQCGMKLFNKLLDEFFTVNLELRSECPRLDNVIYAVGEELIVNDQATDKDQMRHILEGVLAHFFSAHRSSYDDDDIMLFLKLANRQTIWLATYGMDEVINVEFSDDLLDMTPSLSSLLESPLQKLGSYIPLSIFKLYLHQILLSDLKRCDESTKCIMLFFHKTKVHSMISKVLCEEKPDSDPAPYIPTFYQFSDFIEHSPAADEALMQQPLSHLYFLTVLENVANLNFGLSGLITTSQKISKQCRGGSVARDELILLHIEEQAVVQVIIRDVAKYLDIKDNSKINALGSVLPDLNAILDDHWMGGGSTKGHGLVLAMHILKEQQSFNKFLHLFTDQFSMLLNGINCLEPFHQTFSKVQPLQPSGDQASTVLLDIGSDFQALYSRICTVFNAIHNSRGASNKVKDLTRIAEENSSGKLNVVTPSGKTAAMNKCACFKMALFLATYNEFFIKNKPSQYLAQVIGSDVLSRRLGTPCVRLLLCFVDSDHMVKGSSADDPLFRLFVPFSGETEAQSDADLRATLVHMIAVTLGCHPQSTHLCYNMFSPDELVNTFLTGFMYNTPVGPKTKFYDAGVELTPEGFFGRHDYIQHATRGTLNIQSLYLLLWSNFSAFSVALLTQQDAEKKLVGNVMSEEVPVRQYCVDQMFKMWNLLKRGLNISEEERRLLVQGCLNNLLEHDLLSTSPVSGKLHTNEELDSYEKAWHSQIFLPQWTSLKEDFSKLNEATKLPVMKSIMHLNSRYPWFPDVSALTTAVLSRTDIADPSCPVYPLSQFVLQYPRLKMGIDLLPSVVELYQWLHTELTYAVTYEDAATITLGRLAKVASKHLSDHSAANHEMLKTAFNDYIQLTGCTTLKRPCSLSDDTPLLHLLSYSTEIESGNDLLYAVITDVIKFLNQFVVTLSENLSNSALRESYCPESVSKVHVMEFTQHYILAGRSKSPMELSSLINGHCRLPLPAKREEMHESVYSHLPAQLSNLIDVLKLQQDVVEFCIAGMPLIDNSSISSLRIPFIFKEDRSRPSLHVTLRDHAMDLEGVAAKLPDMFKVSLDDAFRKQLEYEFHSASYHGIMEVISGLRTTTGHLIKEISTVGSEKLQLLAVQTLPEFLVRLYEYDPLDDSRDVFHEVGIHSLSQTQHACLESLTLNRLFQTLHLFVRWAEEGWYDFCSLPFAAKMQMSLPDEDFMRQIPEQYEGSPNDLLKELRSLVDLLVHLEPSIVRTLTEKPQRSITKYLKNLQVCDSESKLLSAIPDGVLLEHYVSLRLFLRKLISHMQSIVHQDVTAPESVEDNKWSDFIDDLWDRKLPHFRRKGYVYSSTPPSPEPGAAEENPEPSKVVEELIHYNSETNLMELADEVAPVLESAPLQVPTTPESETKTKLPLAITPPKTVQRPAADQNTVQLAKGFSVQDVVQFLHHIKLGQYATTFEEFEINGEILIQLPDNELEDMGISSALDRLKISTYFKQYILGSRDIPNRQSVKRVVKFLEDTKPLKQFASRFAENDVDSELLLGASDDVMRELGVDTGVHIRLIRTKFKNFPQVLS